MHVYMYVCIYIYRCMYVCVCIYISHLLYRCGPCAQIGPLIASLAATFTTVLTYYIDTYIRFCFICAAAGVLPVPQHE